jgi:hypothetical protein
VVVALAASVVAALAAAVPAATGKTSAQSFTFSIMFYTTVYFAVAKIFMYTGSRRTKAGTNTKDMPIDKTLLDGWFFLLQRHQDTKFSFTIDQKIFLTRTLSTILCALVPLCPYTSQT